MSNRKSDATPITHIEDTIDLLQKIKELPVSYVTDVLRYMQGVNSLHIRYLLCSAKIKPKMQLRKEILDLKTVMSNVIT